MKKYLLALAILGLGIVIGAFATGAGDEPVTASGVAPGDDWSAESRESLERDVFDPLHYEQIVDSLSALVNLEVAERRRLEAEVAALAAQVAALEQRLSPNRRGAAATATPGRPPPESDPTDDDARRLASFVEAGFALDRAEYLKGKQDEVAMQRLFLRDQARREGWMGSSRYSEALRSLNEQHKGMREELGDDDYDRYLFATGRPNRVMVRSVLQGSPAQQAGLQAGDSILSYGGDRVFETRSLVAATGGGSFGTTTPVEVERDGQRMLLYMPRGPLGVNLRVSHVNPTSP